MKKLIASSLAALALGGAAVTADGSTSQNRTVTIVTNSQTIQATLPPGASFTFVRKDPGVFELRVHYASGKVVVVGVRGFQRLSVSAVS